MVNIKKTCFFILKIAIGVLIIAFLISKHHKSFQQGIENFNVFYLVPGVVILLFEMFFASIRWYSLLKIAKAEISVRESISLTMRGYFCSLILPGGAIGGDVAKIGMIAGGKAKGERFEPSLSILIDRIIGMIALFIPALILTIADRRTLLNIDLTSIGIAAGDNIYLWVGFMLFCCAGLCAAIAVFSYSVLEKVPFIKFIFAQADKLTKGLVSRMKMAINLYISQWKTLLFWMISSIFFVHLIQVFSLYFICKGLNIEIPSMLTLTSAIIIGNIAGLIPLTPGGIGLRDITILAIMQAGNFDNAPAVPLLMSFTLIIANLLAGVFFFDKGLRRKNDFEPITESVKI